MAGEFTKFSTVASVLTQAMPELGLAVPSSFVGSADVNAQQVLAHLTAAGQELCSMNDWQMLHREWTQVLTPNVLTYNLPSDWNSFVNSAMWDNTSRWPVLGPIPPQIWRMLKARLLGGDSISLQYRVVNNQVVFYTVTAADTVVADYYSRGWVLQSDNTTYRDNINADDNQILFDTRIVIPFLKYKWRKAKGFDTSSDVDDFEAAWDTVVGRDTPAPTLSIGPTYGYPFIGYNNIPDTGYGS